MTSPIPNNNSTSDFRSDTITRPTQEMREAMANAVVGDDVFGDDPTVNSLEERLATLFGKAAALFVPSGTMANVCAIKSHTQPGDEVILESQSHIFANEGASSAWICGVQVHSVTSRRGIFEIDQLRAAVREEDIHHPRTGLFVLENSHNYHGGAVIPLEVIERTHQLADSVGAPLHIDGARIWNAAVASDTPLSTYGASSESVMACFSKGLGCPVGSALMGDSKFIAQARRVRKALGGGMRQAGVLAAAVHVALDSGFDHLREDHRNARDLAEGLAALDGMVIDLSAVDTNIIFVKPPGPVSRWSGFVSGLEARGVLAIQLGDLGVRFVTHRDVTAQDVSRSIGAAKDVLASGF